MRFNIFVIKEHTQKLIRHLFFYPVLLISISCLSQRRIADFSSIEESVSFKGELFFTASDNLHGAELWKSDGTPEGTTLLKDINEGPIGSNPQSFFAYEDKLYFTATTGALGQEIWVSDGTAGGTKNFLDMATGPDNFFVSQWIIYKDDLIVLDRNNGFRINLSTLTYECLLTSCYTGITGELFVKNGQLYLHNGYNGFLARYNDSAKTFEPFDFPNFTDIEQTYVGEQTIYLFSNLNNDQTLFGKYDFTTEEFDSLASWTVDRYGKIEIGESLEIAEQFFFSLNIYPNSSEPSDELWVSDGTVEGTLLVRSTQWSPHTYESELLNFVSYNGLLYYVSNEVDGNTLWVSDGTAAGTHVVNGSRIQKKGRVSDSDNPLTLWNDEFYFESGKGLSIVDVNNISETYAYEDPLNALTFLQSTNNHFFYSIKEESFRESLWISDPSPKISFSESISFGEVAPNSCEGYFTIINNIGRADLFISKIQLTGQGFYLDKDFPDLIEKGSSELVGINFFPEENGDFLGELNLFSNDPSESVLTIKVMGSSVGETDASKSCFTNIFPPVKTLTFTSADASRIILNNYIIDENNTLGSLVGTLGYLDGDASSFSLVEGIGDTDNGSFEINGDKLLAKTIFDFERQSTTTVRVKAVFGEGSHEDYLIIRVKDVFEAIEDYQDCKYEIQNWGQKLNAVKLLSNGRAVAVGEGNILISDDYGASWKNIGLSFLSNFNKLYFNSHDIGYSIGSEAILKTIDGGLSWTKLGIGPLNRQLLGSCFINDTLGYIIKDDYNIYLTTDGGINWTSVGDAPNKKVSALEFYDENVGYLGTQDGLLYQTNDGGESWIEMSRVGVGQIGSIMKIGIIDEEHIYFQVNQGVYLSSNKGSSWLAIVESESVTAIDMTSPTQGFMFLVGDGLFKTEDGGSTWNKEFSHDGKILSIDQNGSHLVAVGQSEQYYSNFEYPQKMILKAENGQYDIVSYFNTRNSRSSSRPSKIISKGPIVIANSDGGSSFPSISVSSDKGLTFKDASLSAPYYSDVDFYNSDLGVATTSLGVFTTIDGGKTWEEVIDAPNFPKVAFVTSDILLAYHHDGMDGYLYRSEDGGKTWFISNPVGIDPITRPDEIFFLSPTLGFIEDGQNVYKTTDTGLSWQLLYSGDYFSNMDVVSEQIITLFPYDGRMIRTYDGGSSWNDVSRDDPSLEIDMVFLSEELGYGVDRSYVYQTLDGGTTWKIIDDSYYDLNKIVKDGQGSIYFTGRDGAWFKLITPKPVFPHNIWGEEEAISGYPYTYLIDVKATNTGISGWTVEGGLISHYGEGEITVMWDSVSTTHKINASVIGCDKQVTSISKSVIIIKEREIPVFEEEEEVLSSKDNDIILSAYPNPTTDIVSIPGLKTTGVTNVEILSLDGQLQKTMGTYLNQTHFELDMTEFSTGVYIVRVYQDDEVLQYKVIKQ